MILDSRSLEEAKGPTLKRIEICGGIASGKTTLTQAMQKAGYDTAFENFRLNPFIESFYSEPKFYSFETEISFLLQHYSQIKTEGRQRDVFTCDYSLYLDLSYAHVTLKPSHLEIFRTVYGTVLAEIGPPILLVHLRCSARTELERIRKRRREMESGISIQYLESINETLEKYVGEAGSGTKILEINSERLDFAHEVMVQREVTDLVVDALPLSVR